MRFKRGAECAESGEGCWGRSTAILQVAVELLRGMRWDLLSEMDARPQWAIGKVTVGLAQRE